MDTSEQLTKENAVNKTSVSLIAIFSIVCGLLAGSSQVFAAEDALKAVWSEFMHTQLIYESYVGKKDEQIANMLKLTEERLGRTRAMYLAAGTKDTTLESDMDDFGEALSATKHMRLARDASGKNNEAGAISELTLACSHADKSKYLDPRLQETCKRFRKFGYKSFT